MSPSSHDVIIVGSGLAGAAAAYQLSKSGKRILLLEARGRSGGRAHARHYQNKAQAELLEYGGSWITPWHHRIRELCGVFGLTLRPRAAIRERLVMRNGVAGPLLFESDDERRAHECAVARIAADAMMCKLGLEANEKGEALTGISYAQYMARLNPPLVTRHMQAAWWVTSGGGPVDEVSAGEFLSSCAYETGVAESIINVWSDTVEPSMDTLAAKLILASQADVLHGAPVVQITQDASCVRVALASGNNHEAAHAIIATGVNPMQAISFVPALRDCPAAAVSRGQSGRAFKLWIKARGVPVGRLITGDGTGVQMLLAERTAADGSVLLIGFGLQDNRTKPDDAAWVREQFSRLCPNAEFLGYDWHDWVTDPFARGTWLSTPYDLGAEFSAEAWAPQGRIAFASSDIAPEGAGWFEGAVRSGEAAATWVASR
jgi:monoamine oxidase